MPPSRRKIGLKKRIMASPPKKSIVIDGDNKNDQHTGPDFTLISSDDKVSRPMCILAHGGEVIFAILRNAWLTLAHSSPVFRTVLPLGQEASPAKPTSRMHLCDSSIERAKVVKLFLDMIYGIPLKPFDYNTDLLLDTAGLLKKYDCTAARQTYKLALRNTPSLLKRAPNDIFAAAAQMDISEICTLAVRAGGRNGG